MNSDVYIEQITKLNNAVEEKRLELANRKGVAYYQDNARPHTSLVTRQKFLELGWNVLPHPPYSPDLAPSDCFLFRSLHNSLNGVLMSASSIRRRLLPRGLRATVPLCRIPLKANHGWLLLQWAHEHRVWQAD
ncbi:histone-lysine N-methyltransferase SETMAR [Trichonephila clavipes]|nr:histone-lysine N-methyltransferase SETMAR [Trichonephila clavipes]